MENTEEEKSTPDSYRMSIIEMIKEIENITILKFIYGFTKSGYKEEKAGRK